YNADFFEFKFDDIVEKCRQRNLSLAVIGNPPWVTNSRQGKHQSLNVPVKDNSLGLKGIDAITGKSNFDISEYITIKLLKLSHQTKGGISFLLKNSVIRNILEKQKKESLHIGEISQDQINASSEFNVSVDASCFSARFNSDPSRVCRISDFYLDTFIRDYGWINDVFVSDLSSYERFSKYDGCSTLVWRSGIKHDCASVLELTFSDGKYINGFGETVEIEGDVIYPLLKSSDINKYSGEQFRKYIIVIQKNVGEDTSSLKQNYPMAYAYLSKHEDEFLKRKSSIYRDKDKFSIFGIGDYSFRPYKIVVSSLYKDIKFVLVSPSDGKPIMLDDTCYQLGFDCFEDALHAMEALNSNEIQSLLRALIFKDAKRVVTKGLLMRLDIEQICKEKGIALNSELSKVCSEQQLTLF
ncbi:MAG: SAM-dependent methyltransferase, partial [Muribaculaceae bacterium]|nr:SAM-dependent methyltransferase [Muribaculaceae bacterium]